MLDMVSYPRTEHDPLSEAELTVLLGLAFQVVLAEFVKRVDMAGYEELRPVHGMIFQALKHEGATSTELAQHLGITKQAAGQMVDDLVRMGYVTRKTHPAGGRRRLIILTRKAQEHLVIAGRVLHMLEAELTTKSGDLGELRTHLAKVIRAFVGDDIPPLRPVW